MKKSEVDFSKWVSVDDIDEALDNVKGAVILLDGLEYADDGGTHIYQKQGYIALSAILKVSIDKFEEIKNNLEYMDDIARKGLKDD